MQVSPYCSQATISEHDAHVANQMLLLLTFIIIQYYTMPTYIVDSLISNALNDDGRFTPTAPCENIELQPQSLRVTKSPLTETEKQVIFNQYIVYCLRAIKLLHRIQVTKWEAALAEESKRF